MCYKTIAVIACAEIRKKRIMHRDNISAEQAQARMRAQKSEEYYKANSDFIIMNDGSDIKTQINTILEEIL